MSVRRIIIGGEEFFNGEDLKSLLAEQGMVFIDAENIAADRETVIAARAMREGLTLAIELVEQFSLKNYPSTADASRVDPNTQEG